jgi:hypothetical protein
MIIEKKKDKNDAFDILSSLNKTMFFVGGDTWYVYLTSKRYFLLVPSFSKNVFLCETKKDVIKLLKSMYYFSVDPTLTFYEKLSSLERW